MDILTTEQRSRNMQAIKPSGTKIELLLTKALWARGHKYRKNCKDIIGKPDIVFRKYKIAIYSEFWHGKNFKDLSDKIATNKTFWTNKIYNNKKRDKKVNRILKKDGWTVLRFWGEDINKNISKCIAKIESNINKRKADVTS